MDCMMAPTRVLIWDPCPSGSAEILTGAHMSWRATHEDLALKSPESLVFRSAMNVESLK